MTMQLESALTFGLDLNDRLGGRVWMTLALAALVTHDEGLVVCDIHLGVICATPRAVDLLARLGMGPDRVLPESVVEIVSAQMAAGDPRRSDVLSAADGVVAVALRACALEGLPGSAQIAVFVREEQP